MLSAISFISIRRRNVRKPGGFLDVFYSAGGDRRCLFRFRNLGRSRARPCGLNAKPEKGELAHAQTTPFSGLTTARPGPRSSTRFLQFTGIACPRPQKSVSKLSARLPAHSRPEIRMTLVNKIAGEKGGAAEDYENPAVSRPRLLFLPPFGY